MSTLIVEVCKINDILPHENADLLEIAIVKGWECIVKKDQFKIGDKVVYIPPDTILPQSLIDRLGVGNYLVGKNHDRVSCTRLRGEMSFGLIINCENEEWEEGQDVTEYYGIIKYEPPIRTQAGDAAPEDPYFSKFTNIENIRNFFDLFEKGETVVVTEKVDGSQVRTNFGLDKDNTENIIYKSGSHHVNRKRPSVEDISTNTYWYPFHLDCVRNLLGYLKDGLGYKNATLYGEMYGQVKGGLKSMHYGKQGKLAYVAFALEIENKYLDYSEFRNYCEMFNIPMVPLIGIVSFSLEEMKKLSKGKSILAEKNGYDQIREGVVICPYHERTEGQKRAILKMLNDDYLIMKLKKEKSGEIVDYTDI